MKFSIKIIVTESNTTHQRTFCNSLRRRSHKQDTEFDIMIQMLETQLIGFVDKSHILSHILSVLIQLLALILPSIDLQSQQDYATWRFSGSYTWTSFRLRGWFNDPFYAIVRFDPIFVPAFIESTEGSTISRIIDGRVVFFAASDSSTSNPSKSLQFGSTRVFGIRNGN